MTAPIRRPQDRRPILPADRPHCLMPHERAIVPLILVWIGWTLLRVALAWTQGRFPA